MWWAMNESRHARRVQKKCLISSVFPYWEAPDTKQWTQFSKAGIAGRMARWEQASQMKCIIPPTWGVPVRMAYSVRYKQETCSVFLFFLPPPPSWTNHPKFMVNEIIAFLPDRSVQIINLLGDSPPDRKRHRKYSHRHLWQCTNKLSIQKHYDGEQTLFSKEFRDW